MTGGIVFLCGQCLKTLEGYKKCICLCHSRPGLVGGYHELITDDKQKMRIDTSYDWIKDEPNAV